MSGGGLIQLIIKGIQDSPLVNNPEITFFKKVYKQYTQFVLFQNTRYLKNLEFNKEGTKIIEKNGDLLFNQYFKIEIPYFEVNKTSNIIINTNNGYNINILKIIYSNLECIALNNNNNDWLIIPLNLFNSHNYNLNYEIVNNSDFCNNFLHEYINNTNTVKFVNIKFDNNLAITDKLLLLSNYIEQIWTNNIINNARITQLLDLTTYYNNLYNFIYKYIFNNYEIFFLQKNNTYFKFYNNSNQNEIERYNNYKNNNYTPPDNIIEFDIDYSYNYCLQNNFIFTDYINNIYQNSVVILLLLSMQYSSNNLMFTFWKKYNIQNNNQIITNILILNNSNFANEWKQNLDKYIDKYFSNTNNSNYIIDNFKDIYFTTSVKIIEIFQNINFNDPMTLYINLKKIFNRFYAIPYYQVNFNNYYYATKYDIINVNSQSQLYDNDIFNSTISLSDLQNYELLINNFENLSTDDIQNLTPIDLQNVYGLIAYELVDSEFQLKLSQGLKSFLILWRNCVITRLYKRFLDTYSTVKTNSALFNYNENLTTSLYYSIYPSNLYLYDDYINSFYELFFKNSWIGILTNNELKNIQSNLNVVTINNISIDIFNSSNITKLNAINQTNFYNLKITNKYIISYQNYYFINNILYLKYYNYYDNSCNIQLYYNNNLVSYSSIKYNYININNFEGMCLQIVLTDSINLVQTIDFNLIIKYATDLPIVCFYQNNLSYPTYLGNNYILMSKNQNNQIEILNIKNNKIYINSKLNTNSIKILNIIYYNISTEYILVNVNKDNDMYTLSDLNNNIINLPTNFTNISQIFINEFILNYKIITDYSFINNKITLNNITDYSTDYFYYLADKYNYKDYYKLIPAKKFILFNPIPIVCISTYKYIFTYYNSQNYNESVPSNLLTINIIVNSNTSNYINNSNTINNIMQDYSSNNNLLKLSNFGIISGSYDSVKIYRTKLTDSNYYYVTKITDLTLSFTDNINDNLLGPKYQTSINNIYQYKISYFDINTNSESIISTGISITINYNIDTNLSISISNFNNISEISETLYNNIKIYRTKSNSNDYYLLTTTNALNYIDNINDTNLQLNEQLDTSINFYCNINLSSSNNYNILKIPINNLVPNLYPFISHSTDVNYTNTKNLPDINDFIFNKPFIMLNRINILNSTNIYDPTQYSNLFDTNLIYFYNINFKICSNSIITLNNIDVTYLLPVSSEQFFIKNNYDIYYNFINTDTDRIYKAVDDNNITQSRFNPCFDEFNIYSYFLINNNIEKLIDTMINKLNYIINQNSDYQLIINNINQTNNYYLSMFTTIFNNKYGLTTDTILKSIVNLNKIDINHNIFLYDLLNYSNKDYFNNSHYAFRLHTDNNNLSTEPFNFKNIPSGKDINLLSQVYTYYNAADKISSNLIDYLNNVPNFFNTNINYINTNIEYLNLSNPINCNNNYLSYAEIIENKIISFSNIDTININLLHPLISTNIFKIYYNNIYFDLDVVNNYNTIQIKNFNYNIIEDKYEEANLKIFDRNDNNNKFNYIGIASINLNNEYSSNLNSTYFLLDDNKIYQIFYNSTINMNTIAGDINYSVIMNPRQIDFSTKNIMIQNVNYITDKYIYIVEINYSSASSINTSFWGNFIIDNKLIKAYYSYIDPLKAQLKIIECEYKLDFNNINLHYQVLNQNINNIIIQNINWNFSGEINNYKIKLFNKVNYKINNIINNDFQLCSIDNGKTYLYKDFINIINADQTFYYFYNDNINLINIQFINNIKFNQKSAMIIKNNIIYDYLSYKKSNIFEYEFTYYILLVNLFKKRYFILQIKDIINKQIPADNYHCWIYNQSNLNFIKYKLNTPIHIINKNITNISINNLPQYSFYSINNIIYYYENIDISASDININYYQTTDMFINEIYLLDNELFNNEYNSLICQSTTIQNITLNSNIFIYQYQNLDINLSNDMWIKSSYFNDTYKINNINNNNIYLNGTDEIKIDLLTNIDTKNIIYHPLIIKQSNNNFISGFITFNIDNTIYSTSLIPIYNDITNSCFINQSINKNNSNDSLHMNGYYYVGSISQTEKLYSIDSNMIIINNNTNANIHYIYININSLGMNFKLWKLEAISNDLSINNLYFWIFTTSNMDLFKLYIILIKNLSTTEPCNINNISYNNKFKLVSSVPHLLNQVESKLIFNDNISTLNLKFKYYSYNYDNNYIASIKDQDYNTIINYKPSIEFYNNLTVSPNLNIIFFVIINESLNSQNINYINIYFNNDEEYNNMINKTNITKSTIYYSLDYPYFTYNNFTLIIYQDIYIISNYNKLFLENNEIIIIDGKFFIVLGLNTFTDNYELKLIRDNNNILKYNYNGYYTIGVYLHNNNKIIPDLKLQSTLIYYQNSNLLIGQYYITNNNFSLSLMSQNISDVFLFNGTNLNIKLYCSDSKIYLLDNYVKLKKFDILIYIDSNEKQFIISIQNINNNQIYYKNINSVINLKNGFYNFILPYQPFDLYYINIDDNGFIKNFILPDSKLIILENQFEVLTNIKINNISNNFINYTLKSDNSLKIKNFWIKYLNTNYVPYFDNIFTVPLSFSYNLLINFPLNINISITSNNSFIYNNYQFSITPLFISNYYPLNILVKLLSENQISYNNINYSISCINLPNSILNIYPINISVILISSNCISYNNFNFTITPNISTTSLPINLNVQLISANQISYNFINYLLTPITSIGNKFPIELNVDLISNNQICLNNNILVNYKFYYLQPVYLCGTYNFIYNINNNIITLLNTINYLSKKNIKITISPHYCNEILYYSNYKFNYNYILQPIISSNVNAIRCALLNDQLIFTTIINNFISISDYEKNNINNTNNYKNLYFINYQLIDTNNQTIDSNGNNNKYDLIIGKYYLLIDKNDLNDIVYLIKLEYNNKIKFYSNITITNDIYYISRIFPCKINKNYEYTLSCLKIYQIEQRLENNTNDLNLIYQYNIQFINNLLFNQTINNIAYNYVQQINIINSNKLINNDINKIYISLEDINGYNFLIYDNNYYLTSNKYIDTNFNYIYVKINNFIINTKNNLTNKLVNNNTIIYNSNNILTTQINNCDETIYNLINNNIYELLTFNLYLKKYNDKTYIYSFIDNSNNTLDSSILKFYFIYQPYLTITNINSNINNNINQNILKTIENIDNDILEYTSSNIISNIWYLNNLDPDNFYDYKKLYDDVKQLRYKLFLNIKINLNELYFLVKPWSLWSLIYSYQNSNNLNNIFYSKNVICLNWKNNNINVINSSNVDSYYLTNFDYEILSQFLTVVNNNSNTLNNYNYIRTFIEPLIYKNLNDWIINPYFFKNVNNIINDLLSFNNCNAFFDGNNIIFNNDINPIYRNDNVELAGYITNEYTYDFNSNTVYRSKNQSLLINNNINSWLNRNFNNINDNELKLGISIHQLLRYLRILGDELMELYNYIILPFNNVPLYVFNNPYKFIVNKLWEKYKNNLYLQHINPDFNANFLINYNLLNSSEISCVIYTNLLDLSLYGVYSDSYFNPFTYNNSNEYSITKLNQYNNNLIINYITSPLFLYKINFSSYDINLNSLLTYTIFKISESTIYNIKIDNPIIYQNQIIFYSNNIINHLDFIIFNEIITYNIISKRVLGIIYNLNISNDKFINEIYYTTFKIDIFKINKDSIDIIIPININSQIINNSITFDIITYVGLNNFYYNNFLYFMFCKPIYYILNNTFINIDSNIYILLQDANQKYYIKSNIDIINIDSIKIITKLNIINFSLSSNNIIYEFVIDKNFNYDFYSINTLDIIISDSINKFNPILARLCNSLSTINLIFSYKDYENIAELDTLNQFIYTKQIGQKFVNTITSIDKNEEYLYYFNIILPPSTNTIIIVYNISEIVIPITYSDQVNKYNQINEIIQLNNSSIYFNQNNNKTYFTIKNFINNTDIYNYSIIQINQWEITIINYDLNNNLLTIILPSDFILLKSLNYYYKINNFYVDSTEFVLQNDQLTITWNNGNLSNNLIFEQIYIDYTPCLFIPDLNINYTINFINNYQYYPTDNFYIVPYTLITNGNIYAYLYSISIVNLSVKSYNIFLYSNNIEYSGLIFSISSDYIIIAVNQLLDTTKNYSYKIDNIIYNNLNIFFYQNIIQLCNYYKQNSLNSINLFMANDNFNIINNNYQLISYNNYEIIDNNKITQDQSMIQSIKTTNSITTDNIMPLWNNYTKFFKYIRLYFNDQLIEELNENTFNLNYYLYSTEESRKQIDNLTKIKFNNNKWEFYIPLIFWFSMNPGLALPLIALSYTEIKLQYKLNNLSYITTNNLNNNNNYIKINLISDFILLESEERKLFGTFSHEYLINRYITYQSNYINTQTRTINQRFSGLIKDIYLISKPINYPNLTFIPKVINKFDYKYDRYITSLNYYNNYISTNVYNSDIEYNYVDDISIIKNNTIEYNNYINSIDKSSFSRILKLINNFQTFTIWSNDLLKYLMYYEDKYLSSPNRLAMNTNNNIYLLAQYLLYIYSNKTIINEISPVDSIIITVNGTDLFCELDNNYFNKIVPYKSFNNSLPTGYYVYTFSLYPTDSQPSGHLNFTNFDSTTITITSNINSSSDYYNLDLLVKDYNIIRIMSGMGSLAWIN